MADQLALISNWRRHALLGFSVCLTGMGIALGIMGDSANAAFAQGVCLKTGIVLFMWWLALPQLKKLNPWAVGAVAVVAIVAVIRPQLIRVLVQSAIPLAPLIFVLWLLFKLSRKSKP